MPTRFSSIVLVPVWLLTSHSAASELTFEKDIRPIFRAHCFDCHGAHKKLEGELDLRLVRRIVSGGESGASIVRGNASESYLLQRITNGEMPPGEHRVPREQIETVEQWITLGAPTARPEPKTIGPGLGVTQEERDYWAFRPIVRPSVPEVVANSRIRTPVDAFLLEAMESSGLTFAEDAQKTTLVRRAYLDLLGFPPTPRQVNTFLSSQRVDAWETLIDSLLNSPHYGERWGRHWLDVAGYADSEGANERDEIRPWSYKYRDWIIRAINLDMSLDQFITWQLAGDELTKRPYKNMSPEQIDRLTATGFLRMAADGTGAKNNEETRNQVMADTIKIVSSSLLGLSVGCAQCHDHRYDPISQEDYYRLRAVFEPAIDYKKWLQPASRRISLFTDQDIARAAAVEKEAQVQVAERSKKQQQFVEAALQVELEKIEQPRRGELEEAYRTAADKRTDSQKKLLEIYPNVGKLHPGVLYQYNQKDADKLKEIDKLIAKIRSRKPVEGFVRALTEPSEAELPSTKLFYRGDYRQPQQKVEPGGLTIAAPPESPHVIANNDTSSQTSGRRLAYARWLTSPTHPLVARVLVNRIWLNHFGKTFVSTPDEFGKLGSQPTHPKLLDWLAVELRETGWSLKHLHRLIMTSTVYRQAALQSRRAARVDSANRLYSHFPIRRLEAEVIRDSILAVSGCLDTEQFGPAVATSADDAGQIVTSGDTQRRSIYLRVHRTRPVALLKSFDAPSMEVNCARRESSTVATQSLMLMNGDFILKCAQAMAIRLEKESVSANDSCSKLDGMQERDIDVAAVHQLVHGWQLAYGRMPSSNELALAVDFYQEQCRLLESKKLERPATQAMTNYCQSLLSSNEFLYLD